MKAEIEQFAQTNQPESDCKCWFDSKRRILSSDCSVHNQQQTKTKKMKTPIIKLIEFCIEQEKEHSSIKAMALAFENIRLKAEALLYESDDYFEALQATNLNRKFDYEKERSI